MSIQKIKSNTLDNYILNDIYYKSNLLAMTIL
jgi:hypothetical protein